MRRNTIYNLNGVFTLLIKSTEFKPKKLVEVYKNGKWEVPKTVLMFDISHELVSIFAAVIRLRGVRDLIE